MSNDPTVKRWSAKRKIAVAEEAHQTPAPRLSIVVPTLDEADTIDALMHHLLDFWVCGVVIVVVDGGSQDDTVARARPLATRVLTTAPGRARQMTIGARASRGEHLLFLHADTRLPRLADQRVAEAAEVLARKYRHVR
ncbi:glycosyltransferase [Halomonas sp. BC04]|uniref:glycosyltransferase n=1 Tax=Halomonas sp. BC04 TaxID=1403540 RepID=UPI0003ED787C|nr:glycosyltransferase [Halomonas sp. BC04]EWH00295.1 hypothetical protein Q427_20425 [Halomonas sp. BC04]